jgi:pimeloyl-ACP methyl ester carboxylesterase
MNPSSAAGPRGAFLTARIPRSRLATVVSGHFVWEEASDEFAALIAAWVTGGYRQLNATHD